MRTQPGLALAFVCFLCSGRIHRFQMHPDLANNGIGLSGLFPFNYEKHT
jgi:hypothetical protein